MRLITNWKQQDAPEGRVFDLSSPLILLTGDNGSGKSAVSEALELALTGQIGSYELRRNVRQPRRLWRSKPVGADTLFVRLEEHPAFPGSVIRWEQDKGTRKANWTIYSDGDDAPAPIDPDVGLGLGVSIEEIRDAVSGGGAKAEAWLSSVVGVTGADAYQRIKEESPGKCLTLLDTLLGIDDADDDALDVLPADPNDIISAIDTHKKATAEGLARAQRSLEANDGATPDDDAPVDADELREARARVKALEARLDEVEAEEAHVDTLDGWFQEGRRLQRDIQDTQEQIARIRQKIKAMPQPKEGLSAKAAVAKAVQEALQAQAKHLPESTNCPCCGRSEWGARDARMGAIDRFLKQAGSAMKLVFARRQAQEDLTEAEARKGRMASQLADIKARFKPWRDAHGVELFKQVKAGKYESAAPGIQSELDEAQEALLGLESRRKRELADRTAQQKMVEARTQALDAATELLKGAKKALSSLTRARVGDFVEKVKAYFPEDLGTPAIDFKKASVDIGVDRGNANTPAFGGAEACLLVAIALATVEVKREREDASATGPALVVMDDRGLSPATVRAVCARLAEKAAPGDTIIIPTVAPTVGPEGWHTESFWPEAPGGNSSVVDAKAVEEALAAVGA